MKTRRQLHLKRSKRRIRNRRAITRKGTRKSAAKMRGGSLMRVPDDALIAKGGSLMSVDKALELGTSLLHKD